MQFLNLLIPVFIFQDYSSHCFIFPIFSYNIRLIDFWNENIVLYQILKNYYQFIYGLTGKWIFLFEGSEALNRAFWGQKLSTIEGFSVILTSAIARLYCKSKGLTNENKLEYNQTKHSLRPFIRQLKIGFYFIKLFLVEL